MNQPQYLLEVWNLYQLDIKAKCSPAKAKRILNETQSALFRILLAALGYKEQPTGRKMTQAQTASAKEFMGTLNIRRLRNAHSAIEQSSQELILSKASRHVYGGRLNQFLSWGFLHNPSKRYIPE